MPLVYLSCAWVAGIFFGSKLDIPFFFVFLGLVPLSFLPRFRKQKKQLILVGFCLIAFFAGALRFQSTLPTIDETSLQFYNGRGTVEIRGVVAAAPDTRDKSTQLRLSATGIKWTGDWQKISGTALLIAPSYPAYRYGDVLLVTGKLEIPPRLDEFDYQDYLAHQGIYSTILYPKIEILERGKGLELLEWVYSLRNRLAQTLTEILPEPQASLAQGIVLGIRGNIPSSIRTEFSRTGTAHILAISGLHLGIVAGIIVSLGLWIFGRRRYIYVWLALGAVWFYALLTGMYAPVVRAAIMASLFLATELLGRQRSGVTSLAFAAAIMIGISPQILWTASFQMTFLAMAGLILVTPFFSEVGRKVVSKIVPGPLKPLANFISDSVNVSQGALILVWPLIMYYFGIVAFAAPIATFFALPVLPGIIVAGALAGVLGLVALPAAQVLGWIAWPFLTSMLLIVSGFASLPLSLKVAPVTAGRLYLYYLPPVLIILLISNREKIAGFRPQAVAGLKSGINTLSGFVSRPPPRWVIAPLILLAILASFTAAAMPDDNLHVSFLDVGEGDAILIQAPNHQDILVDGGPSPQALSLGLGKKMPFWDRTIELVVLTHSHADHLTGLVDVLGRYEVKQVLSSGLADNSPLYEEWLRLLTARNIKSVTAQAGEYIDLSKGSVIQVLSPQIPGLAGTESDIDNNSIVLRLSMGRISFLLTADIGREAEWELIARRADLQSTVLKVAHHGSDTSTTLEFLAVVRPQLAVIPVGENKFGHPSNDVLARLRESIGLNNIYRLDESGSLEFTTDGSRLWLKKER